MGAIGSIGLPIDCEARLGGSEGRPLATDALSEGEIQLHGAPIFRGYWKNPERAAQTFTPDGWMRTGDLARRRPDGSFEFLGRLKVAINSGGTLIRGEEVDEALLRQPAVLESTTPSIPRGESGKPRLSEVKRMLGEKLHSEVPPVDGVSSGIDAQVIDPAALVFWAHPSNLTLDAKPETVARCDSFTHVNLILQAEAEFEVRIPNRHVKSIKSLRDLAALVAQLRNP